MADDSFQEKTEQATPYRRNKAREEGKVAKSAELNSAVMVMIGFTALFFLGPQFAGQMVSVVKDALTNAPSIAAADPTFTKIFGDNMLTFFTILAPIFGVMLVFAFGVNIAQVGFKITPKALEPKFEKLDVTKGLKRIFSARSGVSLVRDTLKLLIVGLVGYYAIASEFSSFFLLPDMSAVQVAITMGKMAMIVALKIGAAMLILAILDYTYQRYDFEKSIRMSKQDIKDEYKNTDGSPQVKARIRQIQRETARRRMMDDVPKADVVITNPTHLAIALKYDPEISAAPIVLAKGERLIAQRIKEIALASGVPVLEDKPLARALFKTAEVGQTIPVALYRAVAEVLAYVYRLKGKVMK
jgi:flagellar biosynthetic protein FlhB